MLTVTHRQYLDDSGSWHNEDHLVMCIAGAVAPLDKWGDLESGWLPWREELKAAGLPGLHMNDFVGTSAITRERKTEIIAAMLALLRGAGARPVGAYAFAAAEFIGRTPEEIQELRRSEEEPYYKAFRNALMLGVKAINLLPPDELLHVVIAQKPKYIGHAHAVYSQFYEAYPQRLSPLLSATQFARDVAPLQAADMIANTLFWAINRPVVSKYDWLYYDILVGLSKMDPWFDFYPGTRINLNPRSEPMP